MANRLYKEEHIQNIADAIRFKNGTSNNYMVSEMAGAIRSIETSDSTENNTPVETGVCGENIAWELYSDGKLVISGTGDIFNYTSSNTPFKNKNIKNVIINYGVTSIGEYTFYNSSIESIELPNSINSIKQFAFANCRNLKYINMPNSIESIYSCAFSYCNSLTNIVLPESLQQLIGWGTFLSCGNLISITIPVSVISISTSFVDSCLNLRSIFYMGTKTQWDNLNMSDGNRNNMTPFLYCKHEESTNANTINGWKLNVIDNGEDPSGDTENTITFVYTAG